MAFVIMILLAVFVVPIIGAGVVVGMERLEDLVFGSHDGRTHYPGDGGL